MGIEGRSIGEKYDVGPRIGSGGMGEIYSARHRETERQVAIKVLRGDSIPRAEAVERLRREARAAGRIGHDNICEVIDVGRLDDGAPYLVMPLLRGKTLGATIRETGPLPLARCVDLGAQILAGLAAAHAHSIIHRDLKPENVFLVRMGDRDDFVKLLDFGISKIVAEKPTDGSLTETGTVLGTPNYMAPEQVRGRKDLDPRVDIYATGVLLYQMTTARLPFTGDSYSAIISAILLDPFPAPRSLRPELPEELEVLILRAMSRDRAARFPDAETMRAALVALGPGAHEAPAAASSGPRTQPAPAAFGELGTGEGAGAADLSPGGSTGALQSVSTSSTAALRPKSVRRGPASWGWLGLLAAAGVVALVLAFWPAASGPAGERSGQERGMSGSSPQVEAANDSAAARGAAPRDAPAATSAPEPPAVGNPAGKLTDVAMSPDAFGAGQGAAASTESATRSPSDVEIRLIGVPGGATVKVAGKTVEGDVIRLPQADADVPVSVEAPGHRFWQRRVSCREDGTVVVELERLAVAREAGTRATDAGMRQGEDAVASLPQDSWRGRPETVPGYSLGP